MDLESMMMDDAARSAAALAEAPVPARSPKHPGYRVEALYGEEPPEPPEGEPAPADTPEEEAPEEAPEPQSDQQALVHHATNRGKVQALLEEALRLGQQYGLVVEQADGRLAIAGRQHTLRDGSECSCAQCTSYNQLHWFCVVCHSGPFDWNLSK